MVFSFSPRQTAFLTLRIRFLRNLYVRGNYCETSFNYSATKKNVDFKIGRQSKIIIFYIIFFFYHRQTRQNKEEKARTHQTSEGEREHKSPQTRLLGAQSTSTMKPAFTRVGLKYTSAIAAPPSDGAFYFTLALFRARIRQSWCAGSFRKTREFEFWCLVSRNCDCLCGNKINRKKIVKNR